ncbi:MAG: hypothetical protein LUC34_01470 [Campylobacter sp.]|nr:hypothetical protein [Campylobacter sp.]
MIVTTKELSDVLGITQRRVQELENAGVFSKTARNSWDLTACIDSFLEYKIKSITQSYELSEARAKKELAEAELKELALAEKKGEVIAIARLEKDLSDIAATVSNKLYSLPQKLKRAISLSAETQTALTAEIESILNELKDAKIYKDYLRS